MNKTNIDKFEIKNSLLPRTSSNTNVIGFRDNLITKENYIEIKLINYSSVGWVFGLAQYEITPITTNSSATEEVYFLDWDNEVTFFGNNPDLVSSDMEVNADYKNLTFKNNLTHLLLKNPNSNSKHFLISLEFNPDTTYSEEFNTVFRVNSNETVGVLLKPGINSFNLYDVNSVQELILKIIRQSGTDYALQTVKFINVKRYNNIQPYIEDLKDLGFIDSDKTTGNISNQKWSGDIDNELVSRPIYISNTGRLVAIEFDFSMCDTNLDFTQDELYLSTDGDYWELVSFGNGKISFDMSKSQDNSEASRFPMTFPIILGGLFSNAGSYFLYYKIKSKKNGTYIDCKQGNYKVYFYLNK